MTRFVHFQNLRFSQNKAKKMTSRELSRQTLDCIGAKLLIASTAMRAYRNRHLGTLMRCCEANLTRETLEEREAEITNLPWTQTEKDTGLARCRGRQRVWRNKKPVFSLSAVTDEEGHPLENEGQNYLDAGLGCCGMLLEILCSWIDKSAREERTLFVVVGSPLPSPAIPILRVVRGSGVRGLWAWDVCGTRVRSFFCQTTSTVSNRLENSPRGRRVSGSWNGHVLPCEQWMKLCMGPLGT